MGTTLALVCIRACSLLGWKALETSFSESPCSQKMEFGVKSYGCLRMVTCAVLKTHGGSARLPRRLRAYVRRFRAL